MLVTKLGALLVLPIYWKILTPEDFGKIAITQILIQFLSSILDFGISGTIQRHYFEWHEKDRSFHLGALACFSISFSILVCSLLSISAPIWSFLFEAPEAGLLVQFGIWIAFFQNFSVLPFALTRIEEKLSLFSLFGIIQFLTQTAFILYFLFIAEWGMQAYLWGTLFGSVVFAGICLFYALSKISWGFHYQHLRAPLTYALPTAPAGILEGLGFVLDRFVLQRLISLDELGIYSLARQFGLSYNFIVSTLKNSWVPLVYRMVSERKDAAKVISRLSTYYLFILLFSALAVAILVPELVLWIGRSEYYPMIPYIPAFVFAYVLYGIGNIYGRGLDLAKKTQYYWIIYAVGLISNIFFLWILAPKFGAWGAIAALLISGVLRESVLIVLANYFYPRKTDYISIFKILAVQGFGFFALLQLSVTDLLLSTTLKVLIIFVLGLMSAWWLFGLNSIIQTKTILIAKITQRLTGKK